MGQWVVHGLSMPCPRFVHARWQAFGQHLIIGSCAASSFIALEPGGLSASCGTKSSQKNNLPVRFNLTSCLDPE